MKARDYSAAPESATEPELLEAEEAWTALGNPFKKNKKQKTV